METAFEIITSLSENQLAKVYGDLDRHKLFYMNKCIYDGEFHETSLADFSGIKYLMPNQHKYSQDEWTHMISVAFSQYKNAFPVRNKHLNFVPSKGIDLDYSTCFHDFHHRRVILDMFIIFGYHAQLFEWNYPKHFMHKVCDGCIVYKKWLMP